MFLCHREQSFETIRNTFCIPHGRPRLKISWGYQTFRFQKIFREIILPSTDINSTTWPQIQPLLGPSHGLCIACRTLPCKIEIKSKVQLIYLFWNFSNIFSGSDFIKLWNWLKKYIFNKNNLTLKLYKI